jgi:hypothetical protein
MSKKATSGKLKAHEVIAIDPLATPNCDHIRVTDPSGDTFVVRRGGRRAGDYKGATEVSFSEPGEYVMQYFDWQGTEVAPPHTLKVG